MIASAAIYGCEGPELTLEERKFFRETRPFGFILFARNCDTPEQIRRLVQSLRADNPAALIFIDQEGGRVARLKPPHWPARPPAKRFGDLYAVDQDRGRETAYLCARLIAHDLNQLGINADCAPVLDVPAPGAHDIIGDRAYSTDPGTVIALGRAAIDGFLDGGVLPVIKHIPGHGRAMADSHLELPRVATGVEELSGRDFVTFRGLNHAAMAMTAHVVYEAVDAKRPATLSPRVVRQIIRGEIGFDGLLMTDDLSMGALTGSFTARTKSALLAGCDIVLHCNGRLDEMREIAGEVPPLSGHALRRAEAALSHLRAPAPLDIPRAEARLMELAGPIA
ncbi:MAG: beta-N-acetylhexosaminidase [Alphaproteobacteria bacterium]|nr:beta-N-acetylhexosaminidase [Alphaproteobacteria bacterium]